MSLRHLRFCYFASFWLAVIALVCMPNSCKDTWMCLDSKRGEKAYEIFRSSSMLCVQVLPQQKKKKVPQLRQDQQASYTPKLHWRHQRAGWTALARASVAALTSGIKKRRSRDSSHPAAEERPVPKLQQGARGGRGGRYIFHRAWSKVSRSRVELRETGMLSWQERDNRTSPQSCVCILKCDRFDSCACSFVRMRRSRIYLTHVPLFLFSLKKKKKSILHEFSKLLILGA